MDPCPQTAPEAGDRRPSGGCGATSRPVGRDADHAGATAASPGPATTTTCASGSPASAPPAGSTSRPTGWATSGRGGATRTPPSPPVTPASSPARHLDSVPDGGAFDGPLGVVSALRRRRRAARRPGFAPAAARSASSNFADEEGARFGVACAGSRVITGALDRRPRPRAARRRRRHDGRGDARAGPRPRRARPRRRDPAPDRRLRRAARRAGPRPRRPRARRSGSAATSGRTAGGGSTCPARPTTPAPPALDDREDADARPGRRGASPPGAAADEHGCARDRRQGPASCPAGSTPSRQLRHRPGSTPAAPDADAGAPRRRRGAPTSSASSTRLVTEESWTPTTDVRRRPRRAACAGAARRRSRCSAPAPATTPGILATAGIPTAMLFVRNPTGVSPLPRRVGRAPTTASPAWRPSPTSSPTSRDRPLHDDATGASTRCSPAVPGARVRVVTEPTAASSTVAPGQPRRAGRHRAAAASSCPGFANAHSHAFHRALRGRTHDDGGTFWTWRDAHVRRSPRGSTPTRYLALAPGRLRRDGARRGTPSSASSTTCTTARAAARYDDPNAMGAGPASRPPPRPGIRLTLLDTATSPAG